MFYTIVVAIFTVLFAIPVPALTLDEAVATGLRHNPEMQIFRFEEDAAKGQVEKAKLPPFSNPVIEGGLSLKDRAPQDWGGKFRNNRISLSQSVEIAGQRGLRIDAAASNLVRTRLEIRDLERRMRADIKNSFAQALYLRDKEILAQEYLRIQEELAQLVSAKYEAGDVAALEVNLSQVELARARKDVITASLDHAKALLSLKTLIGLPADSTATLEGELSTNPPQLPEMGALLALTAGRPDVKATNAEIKRSISAEKLIKREAIPNITWSLFQLKDEQQHERGATLGISIPLFDRKQGEYAEARARLAQARIREIGVTRMARKEIEESYAAAASSFRELALFRQAILERTKENLDLLHFAFKEGKISFYDVRVAQRETVETRNAYLQSLLTAQRAYSALERAIGGELK